MKDRSLFIDKLKILKSLRETASEEEKVRIDITIELIEDILKLQKSEVRIIDWEKEYIREEAELNYVKKFWSFMLPIVLSNYYPSKSYEKKLNVSEDTLLNMVGEFFYRALDKELFDIFMSMYEKRKETVHIGYEIGVRKAEMTYLPYFREAHLFLNRDKTFEDFSSLGHEYGHGIEFLFSDKDDLINYDSLFDEVISTTFEIISLDYLKSIHRFRLLGMFGSNFIYQNALEEGKKILMESSLFDKWRKLKGMDFDARKPYFEEDIKGANNIFELSKDKTNIYGLLDERFSFFTRYLIGTNIAIELFMLYYHDRDKGLEMIKRFMKLNSAYEDEYFKSKILSLGINPGAHISEFEDYLDNPRISAFKK